MRPASLIEILEWIDPEALPDRVKADLEAIGPLLTLELPYREIAARLQPPRSDDYVAAAVYRIRAALVVEALKYAEEMTDGLRARLEELAAKQRGTSETRKPQVPGRPPAEDRANAEQQLERLRLQGQAPLRA